VVAELLRWRASSPTTPRWTRPRGGAADALLCDARPLRVRGADYSDLARGELAIFEAARVALAATAAMRSATTSFRTPRT
jgi:phosphoenolpyruvate carboxylase